MAHSWNEYYDVVKGSEPPYPSLLAALEVHRRPPGTALDLGCGAGRDTRALLELGWRVYAVDAERDAFARLEQCLSEPLKARLTLVPGRFEEIQLPKADIVNASFSLPFCPPARFPALWRSITASLELEGIFCGHLFGDRDSWAQAPYLTFHSRAQVDALLEGWRIVDFEEQEYDGFPAVGPKKHWHIHQIVAQRF